ncbi:ABC transporter G family member 37 [Hordeum vulgare]|nr:ABC transporter G family member 37 [Hordeum vulgare]
MAFIKGRLILDGILVLHEVIHEIKSKHLRAVFFKIDFHKAYDTVHWSFLREVMIKKCFDSHWITRVMQMVLSGRTAININGKVGPYFPTTQGVRQGDPFSTFLFNLVGDALAAILVRVKGGRTPIGSLPPSPWGWWNHTSQEMTGLTINFAKSEVMVLGYSNEEKLSIANRLNYRPGTFPTTYLGMPISDSRILEKDLRPSVTKLQLLVEPWQGRWLSKAARVVLINSSVMSLLMYLMGFYCLDESFHHDIAEYQARFFWVGKGDKQKCHMVKWSEICKPKDQGSLGIISSKPMNIALLAKWLWRIASGEGGLWLDIIRAKYLHGQPLVFAPRAGGSQFWQYIVRLLPVLRIRSSIVVGRGNSSLFWLDRWCGPQDFASRFQPLFFICVQQFISVAGALPNLAGITFRRSFRPAERDLWDELVQCVSLHSPSLEDDVIHWRLEPNGRFTTKSLYQTILPTPGPTELNILRKFMLPLKICIFLWLLVCGRVPSGTEVLKRNGSSDGLCPLCSVPEDCNHIFFTCPAARFMWSCLREAVGGSWSHDNLPDMFAEVLQSQSAAV